MTRFLLRPRDGLTVKDPRGFSLAGGQSAATLEFPLPPTTAGATRTAIGLSPSRDLASGFGEDAARWQQLRSVRVRGPFIARRTFDKLGAAQAAWSLLFPAPTDAVVYQRSPGGTSFPIGFLAPRRLGAARGAWSGRPEDRAIDGLWHPRVVTDAPALARRKPLKSAPAVWSRAAMDAWLTQPGPTRLDPTERGPARRIDVHVAIRPEQGTAADALLFSHETRELLGLSRRDGASRELAIFLDATETAPGRMLEAADGRTGLWRLGGESRLVREDDVPASTLAPIAIAVPPGTRRFRVVLVTPGRFDDGGFRPDWLEVGDVAGEVVLRGRMPVLDRNVVLRSAAVARPLPVSGWDFALGQPKASARLAPAGSVYFFELADGPDLTSDDLARLWLESLQPRGSRPWLDGYGVVVAGLWPETAAPPEPPAPPALR